MTTVVLSTFGSAFNTSEGHPEDQETSPWPSAFICSVAGFTPRSDWLQAAALSCLFRLLPHRLKLCPLSICLSSFWSPLSSHHPSACAPHTPALQPPLLDSVATSLRRILLSLFHTLPPSPSSPRLCRRSLCPSRAAFQFHSIHLRSLCKSSLIHFQ